MDAPDTLVARYIQDAQAPLSDHARVLSGITSTLAAARTEFIAQWKALLEQDTVAQRVRSTSDLLEQATRALVDEWNVHHDILAYLNGVAEWGAELQAGGVNYVDATRLVATFRRALLPLLMSAYPAGPDLEMAFRALDAHEHAILGVVAVAQLERTQTQLTHGSHQRSVGRLTGGVMHSLNNTMAVIVGRAQILEEQITDEPQREELRAIQKIARTGSESLKRLQQFASERDGRLATRVDVNLIINDVIQVTRFRWRDDAEASGIAIDVVKDLVPVPPIMGQASALRDALVELILNSVEAMPLGGLVTLRTEQVEDMVQIAITDQGEGMDAVTQARAAEALFTTKGAGHIGLGLTTVATIMRELGGTYTIDSDAGEGTTVVLSFPLAGEIRSTADTRPARLARWASILVVDDEPLVRDVAARTFHLRGFRTVAADSGADAVRAFTEQGPFQVVIVDLGMPGMNGFETAKAIKQLNARTIIILMTGWAAELDAKKMREAGIDRAISKPFDVDQVIQLISEALAIQEKM